MNLYHYTSNDAFVSIIRGKKIFLSDLSLSNDNAEGNYALTLIKEITEEYTNQVDEIFNALILGSNLTALGFCLSTEGDMLSQWRAYASDGAGVSVGFDPKAIKNWVDQSSANTEGFAFHGVNYNRMEQLNILADALHPSLENYRSKMREIADDENIESSLKRDKSFVSTLNFLHPSFKYLFLFKDNFFQEEKEYRLIRNVVGSHLKAPELAFEFRGKDNKIIPFQPYPEGELKKHDIREIVLGPKNLTPSEIVEAFLHSNGFTETKVTKSKGSYN